MKVLRIFLSGLLFFCCLFTAFFGATKISASNSSEPTFRGIISVCQIDTFEGGRGSRRGFLLSVARRFEKRYNGVLIMVTEHTLQSYENAIANGEKFDAVSFGDGVNVSGTKELNLDYDFSLGKINGKTFCLPWCCGGYYLISLSENVDFTARKIEKVLVSEAEYTQPITAFLQAGFSAEKTETLSPFDAYYRFTGGKDEYFLGTQRDIIRLTNRGCEFSYLVLSNYNDLYQYIAVTGEDSLKNYYAERFIEFLLDKEEQKKLTQIGMISAFYNVEFEEQALNDLQGATFLQGLPSFTSASLLKEMQTLSKSAITGDDEAIRKIKKLLISP